MRDLGSLIIVHLVERRPEGTTFRRKRAEWPLHITLVPWFTVEDDQRSQLLAALAAYGAAKQTFTVHVGEEELFGPHKEVPVTLIHEQAPVVQLHDDLMAIVRQHDVQFQGNVSSHTGTKHAYRAHITHHQAIDGLRRRFPGDEEIFDGFTVARLLDDGGVQWCEIIQNVTFGERPHEAAA